jgi:dTDP-4-dehydrorhamnose reductase
MSRRLLVTGAQGFVAGSVLMQTGHEWEVHAISRGRPPKGSERFSWHSCDPLDPQDLENLFREISPSSVIHTAAIADIDVAEQNHELARAVNVEMTRTLANLCLESGCRMVHCSTDTVFDGEHAPYSEEDTAVPVNYYGQTKVEAEKTVSGLGRQAVIARLAIVMGLPVMGSGNSFLARMSRDLREGRPVIVPAQEVRTPVDVITVGRALLELAASHHTGIFHLAGNDRLNRMEMARRITARLNLNSALLKPQSVSDRVHRAPRPRDVSLNNSRARAELRTPMRNFDEALSVVLEEK